MFPLRTRPGRRNGTGTAANVPGTAGCVPRWLGFGTAPEKTTSVPDSSQIRFWGLTWHQSLAAKERSTATSSFFFDSLQQWVTERENGQKKERDGTGIERRLQPYPFLSDPRFLSSSLGLPAAQMLNFAMGTLWRQFIDRDIQDFEAFHMAILDIFNSFNASLPGNHYDAPSRKEVEVCFEEWKGVSESEKKKVFIEFMKKKVKISKLDNTTMIVGLVTPPVAMAAKKAGERLPQLKMIKAVPDVVFVPSMTLVALVSAKLSRRIFLNKVAP